MYSTVQQLGIARDFFARAPGRGVVSEIALRHSISRPAVYRILQRLEPSLRQGGPAREIRRLDHRLQEVQQRLQAAHKEIDHLRGRLEPDPERIHRLILHAAILPVSLRDTADLVHEIFRIRVSHEYVRGVVNQASARARACFERLAPERHARQAVGDEIYMGDRPLLVVAEPHSLAVLRLSVEPRLSGEAWTQHLNALPSDLRVFASDMGRAMTSAVDARGWPHQADLFHALRPLRQSLSIEERRCYALIEQEYAWDPRLRRAIEEGEECSELEQHYVHARKKTREALDRFDQLEGEVNHLRAAADLCDPQGRWISPDERQLRIAQALQRLRDLNFVHHRRAANYWTNPKLLTFARQVHRDLHALPWPAGILTPDELRDALVGSWALQRRLLSGEGARIAFLRALRAACLCPEFPALREKGAAILDGALRASSAIETLNSLWRVYQQVKKSFGTDFGYLVALRHNMHRFKEGPRRGRSPFELLGVNPGTGDWLSLVL